MASSTSTNKNCDINFKIISFNVRGIRSIKKRRALFHLFRKNSYDIVCLQESHLLKKDSDIIMREWGTNFHLAEGTEQSKGLLTLFSKRLQDFNFTLVEENDRILISKLEIDYMSFFVLNVYAPCIQADKPAFLNDIVNKFNNLQLNQEANFFILGDLTWF